MVILFYYYFLIKPDESRTFNGSLQTSTSGLKNLNLENADYFDKFQMPSLKPVSENECEVSEVLIALL